MRRIAWQSRRKDGGTGRASDNHYSEDGCKTLCGRKIPTNPLRLDAFGSKTCQKCLEKRVLLDLYNEKLKDKGTYFREVVEFHGGNYRLIDKEHHGLFGDSKEIYIAYGKLTHIVEDGDSLVLTENWLIFKEGVR